MNAHNPASSIDPKEVAFYTRLADTWWDDTGPMWPLHRLNRLRTRYIADAVCQHFDRDRGARRPLDGLSMLDVGCGGGLLSESMAALGARVHGIDVTERNIGIARNHAPADLDVRYDAVTAEALAGDDHRYDVVLNMEVVEHVADLPGFLRATSHLTAPGGLQFVSTINRTAKAWLFAIVGAEYVMRWLPRGTHQWRRFVTPDELRRELRGHGLGLLARTGVAVSPLTRRFRLTPSMAVNYMLLFGRTPGRSVADLPGS